MAEALQKAGGDGRDMAEARQKQGRSMAEAWQVHGRSMMRTWSRQAEGHTSYGVVAGETPGGPHIGLAAYCPLHIRPPHIVCMAKAKSHTRKLKDRAGGLYKHDSVVAIHAAMNSDQSPCCIRHVTSVQSVKNAP